MSTLKDYYDTGADSILAITNTTWWTMNFTASSSYSFVSVGLLMYRAGASTGTVTISIRAVDINNKPTGDVLAAGTFAGDTLTTDTAGEWKEMVFVTPLAVTSTTKYAMQVYRSSATSAVYWKYDDGGAYSGGQAARSTDSGSSWTVFPTVDCMFRTYSADASYIDSSATLPMVSDLTASITEVTLFGGESTLFLMSELSADLSEVVLQTSSATIAFINLITGVGSFQMYRDASASLVEFVNLIGRLTVPVYFNFAVPRPPTYDETKVWDEGTKSWVSNDGRGGGRFQEQVLAIGRRSDGATKIFFKEL
jgi:hypothetical protein